MKTIMQPHGVHYEFNNGYTLSVLNDWAAMGTPGCPYEFMAWGNGKKTEAVGYQTKEDIDKIISMFEENNTELIDKFFDDYPPYEPCCPEPPVPVIAVVTSYMGTEYDNTETIVYWKVRYISADSGELLEDMTFKGQFDYQYDEEGVPSHDAIVAHACTFNNSIDVLAVHRF
jgi:hypothetical protein